VANAITIAVENPDVLLNVGMYGAGAIIRLQSGAVEAGPFADEATVAIVSGDTSYTLFDMDGTSSTWYRSRYENAGGTSVSDWTEPFPAAPETYYYVTPSLLKQRANIPDTEDDSLIALICNEVNGWIDNFVGRLLRPFTYTDALFDGWRYPDGDVADYGRSLMVPNGIRSITTLEIASGTGGNFVDVTADTFMRSGTPATRIVLSNVSTAGFYSFPGGYANIRLNGAGGPATIPDDVRGVALAVAVRAWHGRQSGHTDIVGTDQVTGNPVVSRWVATEDKRTLERYQPALVA
jgi:hypothetical protein